MLLNYSVPAQDYYLSTNNPRPEHNTVFYRFTTISLWNELPLLVIPEMYQLSSFQKATVSTVLDLKTKVLNTFYLLRKPVPQGKKIS